MNPRVASVRTTPDLLLYLEFADGRRAKFDLAPYIDVPVFAPLKDPDYFSKAVISHGTVEWPGGIDFDPDTLYLDSQDI